MAVTERDLSIEEPLSVDSPVSLAALARIEPCHESWDAMQARERGRHCDSCNMQVFDLSSMTAEEANATLEGRQNAGERTCVRYGVDAKGDVVFAPKPQQTFAPTLIPKSALLRRSAKAVALVVPMMLAACTDPPRETESCTTSATAEPKTDTLDRSWHIVGANETPPHVLGGGTPEPETEPVFPTIDAPPPVPPVVRVPPVVPVPPVRHVMGAMPIPRMGKIAAPR